MRTTANVFDLWGKISIDTSGFTSALSTAKNALIDVSKSIVGFAGSSVKTGMTFDKSMAQVAATLGKTVDEVQDLREFAQKMGSETAFSASQSADALNYMALAGYDAQTSMEMLPNVLNLAAAGTMDLAMASDMVTDTATAFGMVLEDNTVDIQRVTQMVDEMAKAASTGNTSVSQLGDAFLVVGGLAQELNGGMVNLSDGTTATVDGIQELEIALTGMANAGIKGSEAGTHMRNMLLKLSSPSDDGATALSNLGVKVFDVEGNMRSLADIFGDLKSAFDGDLQPSFESFYKQMSKFSEKEIAKKLKKDENAFTLFGVNVLDSANNVKTFEQFMSEANDVIENGLTQQEKIQAISDLFNARDIASAEALLAAVNQDWDKIGESILDADNAADAMAKTQLDNLSGDITIFESALEGIQIALSDKLTPSLRKFVQFGTKSISKLTEAFKEKGLKGAIEAVGETIFNSAEELLPYLADTASDLLAGLAEILPEKFPILVDTVLDLFNEIADKMSEKFPALEPVFDVLTSSLSLIKEVAESAGNGLKMIWDNFLSKVVGETWNVFSGFLKGLADTLDRVSKNQKAVDTLTALVTTVLGLVVGIKTFTKVLALAKVAIEAVSVAGGVANAIFAANPIGLVITAIGALIAVIVEVITYWDYLVLIWDTFVDEWTIGIKAIGREFKKAWDDIVNTWDWFWGEWRHGCDVMGDTIVSTLTKIGNSFTGAWDTVIGSLKWFIGQWRDGCDTMWNNVVKTFKDIGGFFKSIWDNVVSTFTYVGTQVGEAIGGAFKSAVNAVIWTVEGALNAIPNAINGMIGTINSIPGVEISMIPTVTLPRLAKGGVLKKGQMAFLEGQGDEAVIPLSQNTEWIDKVAEKLSEKRQSVYYNLEIHIDKMGQTSEDDIEQFADRLMEVMNEKETRRRYVMV